MTIYTDGACSANGTDHSSGGYGVVTFENNQIVDCYSHFENDTTNNRQELKAILYALIKYGKVNPMPTVYSDSNYCVQTLTTWMYGWARNSWIKSDKKQPENLDLIKAYYDLTNQGYQIQLMKIPGHSGILGNEIADKLATGTLTTQEVIKKYG